jgi:betaine-aldehyde dehydrogenase
VALSGTDSVTKMAPGRENLQRLDFDRVRVDCHIPPAAEMPHGGFGHSGHGRDLSPYGLEDYTRIKHVMHHIEG